MKMEKLLTWTTGIMLLALGACAFLIDVRDIKLHGFSFSSLLIGCDIICIYYGIKLIKKCLIK